MSDHIDEIIAGLDAKQKRWILDRTAPLKSILSLIPLGVVDGLGRLTPTGIQVRERLENQP